LYPVACAPQSWAAGAVFLLLQSCLGLRIDAGRGEVRLEHPRLPETLQHVRIRNLAVGDGTVDLLLEWYPHDIGTTVLSKSGDVRVVVVK
jgi:glycogen debranching enzyme